MNSADTNAVAVCPEGNDLLPEPDGLSLTVLVLRKSTEKLIIEFEIRYMAVRSKKLFLLLTPAAFMAYTNAAGAY